MRDMQSKFMKADHELRDALLQNESLKNDVALLQKGQPIMRPDVREEKRLNDEIDRLNRLNDELRQALGLIEHELMERGLHRENCPGSHPAYCECSTGAARRLARHALEVKQTEKRKGPIMHVPGCGGHDLCSCKPVFGEGK